eukprot:76744_1
MGQKQSKKEQAKEKGGGGCGFVCGVLIIIAVAVNQITHPTGDEGYWCGYESCDGDGFTLCGVGTYSDLCDLCLDTLGLLDDDACDDPCAQATSGMAWILLNIIAAVCCVGAALAVVLGKGKQFAKFGYIVAGLALLGAIVWFCFSSPTCYNTESDLVEPALGVSMILDIIAMVILFMAVYCVC